MRVRPSASPKVRPNREQRGGDKIECEQQPDEPRRSCRPVTERQPIVNVVGHAVSASRQQVRRVVGEGCDDRRREQKRNAEAAQSIADEARVAFALKTRPYEQPGNEKHQRHEEVVVEAGEQAESNPVMRIHHHESAPVWRLGQQRRGLRGRPVDVREHRMMREHQHNEEASEVADRDVAGGSHDAGISYFVMLGDCRPDQCCS